MPKRTCRDGVGFSVVCRAWALNFVVVQRNINATMTMRIDDIMFQSDQSSALGITHEAGKARGSHCALSHPFASFDLL